MEDVRQLSKEDQQMASILREAEEQGLLEVYLAQIDLECHSKAAEAAWSTRAYSFGIKDSHTHISNWRRVNGSDPVWNFTSIMKTDMKWEVGLASCSAGVPAP